MTTKTFLFLTAQRMKRLISIICFYVIISAFLFLTAQRMKLRGHAPMHYNLSRLPLPDCSADEARAAAIRCDGL